ncbi:MAG: 2-hydroxyacyl-CoA dehydratase [Dehalococcoidales bacterium]|nr:2-hydroxyacyl-CoA dehydratase [Dehalococcoidales bacterium]
MEEERLADHLRDRPEQLQKARADGVKLIGYFPGNYVPEEIIYASGAIPICLTHGGSAAPAEEGLSAMPRVMCPFARAQIGERLLKTNPYYNIMDMFVAPITCQHLKKVAEIWEYFGDIEIFKLGIPQQCKNDFELEYYYERLKALKKRLEAFTGNAITDEKLGTAIALYNRMRKLFNNLGQIHSSYPSLLSALDFVKLNHASFYADPVFMVDTLESIYNTLKDRQPAENPDAPKIMLIAPNIGYGDYTVLELFKSSGGEIVFEEVFEGMRYCSNTINNEGDSVLSLARGYLLDRMPCAFMRDSARKRLDYVLGLVKQYNISGVIWYELLGCESYDAESFYFAQQLEERNIPMLILESDYGTVDTGQFKTRIEGFIEIVRGVI